MKQNYYLYHVTDKKNLPSIRRDGLLTRHDKSGLSQIFLTPNKSVAKEYLKEGVVYKNKLAPAKRVLLRVKIQADKLAYEREVNKQRHLYLDTVYKNKEREWVSYYDRPSRNIKLLRRK